MREAQLRRLPSVDAVLRSPGVERLTQQYLRSVIVAVVRDVLDTHRSEVAEGAEPPDMDSVGAEVAARVARWSAGPRRVINATGVILHTNLGRAPLSDDALRAMSDASGYSDLEYDLVSGDRGSRQSYVRELLRALTGSEDAIVLVNNAAAVLLALTALARGREVIVSRGEAVEIGGGFRIPVILRQSGARLVEVGTTNRTRVADFEEAMTPRTGAILKVHSSNFRVVGFTEQVETEALSQLSRRAGLPLLVDNGSGSLIDTTLYGLAHEPTPMDALEAGADLVAFSGDKLLGGPQSGILVGRSTLIDTLRKHPLARALRADKIALAGLSATLLAYLRGVAVEHLPVWQMISQTPETIRVRSEQWRMHADQRGLTVELRDGESTVGGGSLPGETMPTTLIALPRAVRAAQLRHAPLPVLARTQQGHVLLDLRTVRVAEEDELLDAVATIVAAK